MRVPLSMDMEVEEILGIMSEGDPQAVFVLTEIMEKNKVGAMILLDMDDMNIRGKQIPVGVDACHGSIRTFVNMVYNRSQWLCDEINTEIHTHKAVPSGASDSKNR